MVRKGPKCANIETSLMKLLNHLYCYSSNMNTFNYMWERIENDVPVIQNPVFEYGVLSQINSPTPLMSFNQAKALMSKETCLTLHTVGGEMILSSGSSFLIPEHMSSSSTSSRIDNCVINFPIAVKGISYKKEVENLFVSFFDPPLVNAANYPPDSHLCCYDSFTADGRGNLLFTRKHYWTNWHDDSDTVGHATVSQIGGKKQWIFYTGEDVELYSDDKRILEKQMMFLFKIHPDKFRKTVTSTGSTLHFPCNYAHTVLTLEEDSILLYSTVPTEDDVKRHVERPVSTELVYKQLIGLDPISPIKNTCAHCSTAVLTKGISIQNLLKLRFTLQGMDLASASFYRSATLVTVVDVLIYLGSSVISNDSVITLLELDTSKDTTDQFETEDESTKMYSEFAKIWQPYRRFTFYDWVRLCYSLVSQENFCITIDSQKLLQIMNPELAQLTPNVNRSRTWVWRHKDELLNIFVYTSFAMKESPWQFPTPWSIYQSVMQKMGDEDKGEYAEYCRLKLEENWHFSAYASKSTRKRTSESQNLVYSRCGSKLVKAGIQLLKKSKHQK